MALQKTYTQLLSYPTADVLSPTVTINYITTNVTLTGSDAVASHIKRLNQTEFISRNDRVLNAVETGNTVVLETETEIKFAEGGGQFLPKIDSSFLADQTVLFALVHVVEFRNGLIEQIRLYWDQGTLLKQVGSIGRNGMNWPIAEGKHQIQLIAKSIKDLPAASNGVSASAPASKPAAVPQTPLNENGTRQYKDPHASLDLFSPSKEADRPLPKKSIGGYRPPTRDLVDIVGTVEEPRTLPITPPKKRSDSSSTTSRPKHLTHGSQFEFGDGEDVEETPAPRRSKKHDPSFEFGDGEDAPTEFVPPTIRKNEKHAPSFDFGGETEVPESPTRAVIGRKNKPETKPDFLFGDDTASPVKDDPLDRPIVRRNPKHGPSWDFEQFSTPAKVVPRHRPADTLHFRLSDHDEADDASPAKPVARNKIKRTDTETHFSFADDSDNDTPKNPYVGKSFGGGNPKHSVLGDATNRANSHQFEFTDASPAPSRITKNLSRDKEAVVNTIMKPHYDLYSDSSPAQSENAQQKPGRTGQVAGRKKQENKSWGWGEEDDASEPVTKPLNRGKVTAQKGGDFWDF